MRIYWNERIQADQLITGPKDRLSDSGPGKSQFSRRSDNVHIRQAVQVYLGIYLAVYLRHGRGVHHERPVPDPVQLVVFQPP